MILSGEKKEEYREIKPYYRSRLIKEGFLDVYGLPQKYVGTVMFRNGYSHNSPSFVALCMLMFGPADRSGVRNPEESIMS